MGAIKSEKEKNPELMIEDVSPKSYGYGIRHLQIMCMCLCTITLFIARGSMGVAILAMTDVHRLNDTGVEIYDWDKKTQGIVLSSFFWGYVVMQIPVGILSKKFGGKPILVSALILNGTICLFIPLMAKLGGWPLVCMCRVLMGLTQASTFPASQTLLGQWTPAQERTLFVGIVYGGGHIGTIIAMPVSGLLADTDLGWKLIFYSMGALLLSVGFLFYFTTASTPGQHKWISFGEKDYIESGLNKPTGNLKTPWKEIMTTRQMWGVTAAHIGSAFGFTVFFVDLPTYLEMGLGISLKTSASISALPYVGMWVAGMSAAAVSERIANKKILPLSMCRKMMNSIANFAGALCLIALSFMSQENKSLAIVVLVLTISSGGLTNAGYMCNHLDLSPNFAGVLFSITNCISNFGAMFAPVITSAVLRNDPTDVTKWRIVFLITAAILVVTNLIYVLLVNSDRQEWDDPSYMDKKMADPEEMKPVMSEKEKEVNQSDKT